MIVLIIGLLGVLAVSLYLRQWHKNSKLRSVKEDRQDIAADLAVVEEKQELKKETSKLNREESKL